MMGPVYNEHSKKLLFLGGRGCGWLLSELEAVQLSIGHSVGAFRVSCLEEERVGTKMRVQLGKALGPAGDRTHLSVLLPVLSCRSFFEVLEWL